MNRTNRERLKTVAQALGELKDEVVFLGGAVVGLYATDPAAPDPRPTMDVDCIIEVQTRASYYQLEESLRAKGFVNDQREGAPLCRWIVRGITVDVMPTDPEILGFSNEWYIDGFHHTQTVSLNDGVAINLLEAPYFVATKLAAMKSRGTVDLRTSEDFEDIVYILRNRGSLVSEIQGAAADVREYLATSFAELLVLPVIDEAISSVLDFGEPSGTQARVRSIMLEISSVK